MLRAVVVHVRVRDAVLRADRVALDDLVHVVELVPVLVHLHVAVQRLVLRTTGDRHVQRLRREEGLLVEQVEVVLVRDVRQQLVRQPVQVRHDRDRQMPVLVRRTVRVGPVVGQRAVVVQPVDDRRVVLGRQVQHLDRVQRLHVQDVVAVVQRGLFVVEGREAHSLEVAAIALLLAHHHPHRRPLRDEHRLDHHRHLVHQRDGARDVIQNLHHAHLLPRHRHVLQQL